MPEIPPAVTTYLCEWVERRQPGTLLVVSDSVSIARAFEAAAGTDCAIEHHRPGNAAGRPGDEIRFDLAVITDALESLERSRAERLLVQLRDLYAKSVMVAINTRREDTGQPRPTWQRGDFIALGFKQAENSRDLADHWRLYRYDIHDYKTTPSWLNARFWANPGRWNKSRW